MIIHDSPWLKEVLYYPNSDTAKYCFMKSSPTPSQDIYGCSHEFWILIKKKNSNIKKAYCTCISG